MSDWISLSTVVARLCSDALLRDVEAGSRLQAALANGAIRTRTISMTAKRGRSDEWINVADHAADDSIPIKASFWEAIGIDWSSRYLHCEFYVGDLVYSSHDIEACRSDALKYLKDYNAVSGTEKEAEVFPPAAGLKNKGGNPGKYDWEGALIEMARVAVLEDDCDRTTLQRRILDWFSSSGLSPSESQVREKVKKFHEAIWPAR